MDGITWRNVQGEIPQPVRAEDADHGGRRVEARLWCTPASERPYRLQFQLWESSSLVDTWIREYEYRMVPYAHQAYEEWRSKAAAWLQGSVLYKVRPRGIMRANGNSNGNGAP